MYEATCEDLLGLLEPFPSKYPVPDLENGQQVVENNAANSLNIQSSSSSPNSSSHHSDSHPTRQDPSS
jgi:hypothetical protein